MPNLPVDVNSWGRSACYPQGSFCPLSDGHSILHRRITNSDFRPCSTCGSRSQALFCVYARRMVSNHSESTFERLRYSLGGDRPSQTACLTRSPYPFHGTRLELRSHKSGIPTATDRILAYTSQRLPPILYMPDQNPISSYSKAPWGLSV